MTKVKIKKTKSSVEIANPEVRITDYVIVHIDGVFCDRSDIGYIRKKYNDVKIRNTSNGTDVSFKCNGVSKCSNEDRFDESIGKTIAGTKCWDKVRKKTNKIVFDISARQLERLANIVRTQRTKTQRYDN